MPILSWVPGALRYCHRSVDTPRLGGGNALGSTMSAQASQSPSGAEQRSGADGPQWQLFPLRVSVPGGRRSPPALGAMSISDEPHGGGNYGRLASDHNQWARHRA